MVVEIETMTTQAQLKVYAVLGEASGKTFEIDIPEPVRLREVLEKIARHKGFYARLFDEAGELKRSFTVLVNGSSIYYTNGLDTMIKGGDEVTVLAFVTGG